MVGIMHHINFPSDSVSYTQWRQANILTQGAYRPYMIFARGAKGYQEIGVVYSGGGGGRGKWGIVTRR